MRKRSRRGAPVKHAGSQQHEGRMNCGGQQRRVGKPRPALSVPCFAHQGRPQQHSRHSRQGPCRTWLPMGRDRRASKSSAPRACSVSSARTIVWGRRRAEARGREAGGGGMTQGARQARVQAREARNRTVRAFQGGVSQSKLAPCYPPLETALRCLAVATPQRCLTALKRVPPTAAAPASRSS